MAIEDLDFTNKETWSRQHISEIASRLGYVLNRRFEEVFDDFRKNTVANAGVTLLLFPIAKKHFREIKPPLEQVKR